MVAEDPSVLPIEQLRGAIVSLFQDKECSRVIIGAETGSGKSTQVPQMILDGGCLPSDKRILVLQPRRIAARMLAKRVAAERGEEPGHTVGFRMRHAHVVSAETRIEYITEGMLTQRILNEPKLDGVGAILFDEFHERSLQADVALALALDIQNKLRPDLRIGVMSATLDTERVSEYLNPCRVLSCSGRTFPVDIRYAAQPKRVDGKPIWEQAAWHLSQLFEEEPEGSCLVFMPGAFEIGRTLEALERIGSLRQLEICALHGEMSPEKQDFALNEGSRPKVIVSTNVAETSLTIPGVTKVVDSGLARKLRYDPHRGINTLYIEPISRASADQRAGRAGRLAPGRCVRMWGQSEHGNRPVNEDPELLRVDLSDVLLTIGAAKHVDWDELKWMDYPDQQRLERARSVLNWIGALDASGHITEMGRQMARMSVHPRYARVLLEAAGSEHLDAICVLVALFQERDVIMQLKDRRKEKERVAWWEQHDDAELSDLWKYLIVWEQVAQTRFDMRFCREWGLHGVSLREAAKTARQLRQQVPENAISREDSPITESLARCFLRGFPDHVGRRLDRGTLRCELVGGKRGDIRRESGVRQAQLFVAIELDERTSRGGVSTYLDKLTAIDLEMLRGCFPDQIKTYGTVRFDKARQALEAVQVTAYRDLVIKEEPGGEVDAVAAAEFCAGKVLDGDWKIRAWDASVEQWIERVNCVAQWQPELGVSVIDEAGRRMMLEEICSGASREKDLVGREVWPVLKAWIPDMLHPLLDHLAPEEFLLPTRRKPAKLRYDAKHARVILPATVQELYDLKANDLKVCDGAVSITIEVLAPNRRPVQLTDDLVGFWERSYPQIKKDLAGRYPKHDWR